MNISEDAISAIQNLSIIPEDKFAKFSMRVASAIELYRNECENARIAEELQDLNKLCRKPDYRLLNFFGRVSSQTLDVIECYKALPDSPTREAKVDEFELFARAIRERIVQGAKKYSDRIHHKLIGPKIRGRPRVWREAILVSFVTFAYRAATGQKYRRKWDSDDDLPLHQILSVIFDAIGCKKNVDCSIRRQRS